MDGGQPLLFDGGLIRPEAVGGKPFRREPLFLEQLAKEPACRLGVSPRLDEEIKHLAFVINGAPKPMPPSADLDDHLVQMPTRARPRALLPEIARDHAAELQEPTPDRFIRCIDPTFGKQFLYVTEGQREAGVEPDGVKNDRRRKAMTLERDRSHRPSL